MLRTGLLYEPLGLGMQLDGALAPQRRQPNALAAHDQRAADCAATLISGDASPRLSSRRFQLSFVRQYQSHAEAN
jgi:hypothetical protein